MFVMRVEIDDTWIAPVYDHVHHGRILSLFERAREGLVAEAGFPNEVALARGHVIVVTNVVVAYKREVRRGLVDVTCDSVEVDGRTFRLGQRIINERQKVAVDAVISLMFMDGTERRGMLPPDDFVQALRSCLPNLSSRRYDPHLKLRSRSPFKRVRI